MISVCMATYNGEEYIKEQLASILIQLGNDDEVIISDDNSTDKTVKIIQEFNDKRVKLYYNERKNGYTGNFENAILKATGNILFMTDQDDVWHPEKVEKMLSMLNQYDMVISDAEIVDEFLHTTSQSHFVLRKVKKGFWINFLKTRYIGACMAFHRKILSKALPFPGNHRLCAYDYWLTLVAEFYFSVGLLYEPLIKYRRHGKNASTGGGRSTNSLLKKIVTRVYCFIQLIGRR